MDLLIVLLFYSLSYESGHIVTLAAWSLGLVACAMVQDPLDAWGLELDPWSESGPGLAHQVEL